MKILLFRNCYFIDNISFSALRPSSTTDLRPTMPMISGFLVGAGGGVLSKMKEKRGEGRKERKLANSLAFEPTQIKDQETKFELNAGGVVTLLSTKCASLHN